ncbi:LLM class flavin-dependent oxidoreductase [Pseudonocardia kongjuensis]|uniref:LLM class flavin-dependent oxidoreductase n=1 Tax=Pseudonocardia kongjuensis TaxID=102227 RepID=A0ABN1XLD1_9PSEU
MSTTARPLATGRRTPKPRLHDGTMRFGLMWPNSPSPFVTSRTIAEANPDVLDVDTHVELARTAEEAGVDFVFFADGYTHHGEHNARVGHGEPCVSAPIWAPIVMSATQHIGVVTTMHARYLSPVVLARLGANLDVLSGGRWGWNIVPGSKGSEAELFGMEIGEHDDRYAAVAETLQAVRALWGAKGSPIEFEGRQHTLRGTPRGPYPVQDSPLIFNAGVSPAGQAFLAQHADYAFYAVVDDQEKVRATVRQVADRVAEAGREPGSVGIVGSIGVVLDSTTEAAKEKLEWISAQVDLDAARGWARTFLAGSQSYRKDFGDDVDRVARRIGLAAGARMLVGSPADVAEQLIQSYRDTGLANYMLTFPLWAPSEVARLREVLPHLERAGVWRPPAARNYSW